MAHSHPKGAIATFERTLKQARVTAGLDQARANSRLAESEGFPYGRFCDSVSVI